jgi:nucleoside-diphosphate kinase
MATTERTLSIIKPDAVERHLIGEIIKRYEKAGFRIVAMKMVRLTKDRAKQFYAVHRERVFFESLITFMAEGPIVAMVLEGEKVIQRHRDLMGATDPKKADQGTIRRDLGMDIEHNIVHGSDSPETANFEVPFFFTPQEIVG